VDLQDSGIERVHGGEDEGEMDWPCQFPALVARVVATRWLCRAFVGEEGDAGANVELAADKLGVLLVEAADSIRNFRDFYYM
jgi:hypothetical protein